MPRKCFLGGSTQSAVQQAREAAKQQLPAKNTDDVEIPTGLNPALHEHYRQMHQKSETSTSASQPASQDSHNKSLAESAVASIQSNLDRAEAQKLLANAGKLRWELTYRTIANFIEKRKHQRAMAGR